MAKIKTVSRYYAKKEFEFTGLILILYSLFVLYVPFVLSLFLEEIGYVTYNGLNIEFISQLVCLVVGSILPFLMLRLYFKKSSKDFLGKADIKVSQLLIDFVVFFVAVIASIYVTTILATTIGIESGVVSSIGIVFNTELMRSPLYLFAFIILTPLLEEYVFRGILLNCLSKYGKYFAVIATSIVYCFAHGSFIEMIPSFLMSIILCKISIKYKSIRPTIFIHVLFNALLGILGTMPENLALYEEIIIGVLILLAVYFLFSKKYHIIHVRKSNTNNKVGLLFLSSTSVIVALLLFIAHTLLTIFIV